MSRHQWLLVAAFALLSVASNLLVPVFEAPDECWHLAYIRRLAAGRGLPNQADPAERVFNQGFNPPLAYLPLALAWRLLVDPADDARLTDLPHDWHADAAWLRGVAADPDTLPPMNADFRWLVPKGSPGRDTLFRHPDAGPLADPLLNRIHLLRLFSTCCGILTLVAIRRLLASLFPHDHALVTLGLAVIAFQPQFIYLSGTINPDNVVTLLVSWLLTWTAELDKRSPHLLAEGDTSASPPAAPSAPAAPLPHGNSLAPPSAIDPLLVEPSSLDQHRGSAPLSDDRLGWRTLGWKWWRSPILLGVIWGAAMLAKPNASFAGPIAAAGLAVTGWRRGGPWAAIARVLLFGACFLLVAGPFFLRNALLYGRGDLLGWQLRREQEPMFAMPATERWQFLTHDFLPVLFETFWGSFSWGTLSLPAPYYLVYVVITLAAGLGFLRIASHILTGRPLLTCDRSTAWLVAGALLLNLAAVVSYSLRFVGHQGRYLFPSLGPFAGLVVVGFAPLLADASLSIRPRLIAAIIGLLALLAASVPITVYWPAYLSTP